MRKRVRRRILSWSIVAGAIATVLAAGMILLLRGVIPLSELRETNREALNRIHCRMEDESTVAVAGRKRCDISEMLNDPGEGSPDYVLTRDSHFFLITSPAYPEHWLNVLDLAFVRGFRQPATIVMPTDETWRLYSQAARVGPRTLEVLTGVMEKGPATFVEVAATPQIDQLLVQEAKRIVSRMSVQGGHLSIAGINTKVDTWQIVDGETGRVIRWIENAVGRFPSGDALRPGISLHWERGYLVLTRMDVNTDLLAATVSRVGNVWALAGGLGAIFAGVCASVYAICATRFRRFFLLMGGTRVTLAEALKTGEGQYVEFKRVSENLDSILKAVTAFANTNDGTVFVGIGDDHRIHGIGSGTPEEKDRFCQRVLNAVRGRIRPIPFIDIEYESYRDMCIAMIFVPRGEERIYSLGGRFYVRKGLESVFAEGDDIMRLMEQYA